MADLNAFQLIQICQRLPNELVKNVYVKFGHYRHVPRHISATSNTSVSDLVFVSVRSLMPLVHQISLLYVHQTGRYSTALFYLCCT